MHLLILLKVTFVMTIRNVSSVSMHTYLVIMPSNLHHSTQNDTMQTSLVALGCVRIKYYDCIFNKSHSPIESNVLGIYFFVVSE